MIRMNVPAGTGWQWRCDASRGVDGLFMGFRAQNGDAGLLAAHGPSFRKHSKFVRVAAGPVDHAVVLEEGSQPRITEKIAIVGGTTSAGWFQAGWAVWGGTANCTFKRNGREIKPTKMSVTRATRLGAERMGAIVGQSSAFGEAGVAGHFERRTRGTVFGFLTLDEGVALARDPLGSVRVAVGSPIHYPNVDTSTTQVHDGEISIWGEKSDGVWSFDVLAESSAAPSSLGFNLWLLEVP